MKVKVTKEQLIRLHEDVKPDVKALWDRIFSTPGVKQRFLNAKTPVEKNEIIKGMIDIVGVPSEKDQDLVNYIKQSSGEQGVSDPKDFKKATIPDDSVDSNNEPDAPEYTDSSVDSRTDDVGNPTSDHDTATGGKPVDPSKRGTDVFESTLKPKMKKKDLISTIKNISNGR